MRKYKRAEIVSWLEEYASDMNNHFGCLSVDQCECELGSAKDLYQFILNKLAIPLDEEDYDSE